MRSASVSVLFLLALVATLPAMAGESPYNPGKPSNSEEVKKIPNSYYCTAQGNGESTWYVTGFEPAPHFGTPQYQTFQADSSSAFTDYTNATYGRNRVLYAHCTVGPTESLRPSWDQMQHDSRFKETVHVNWRHGQSAAPAM